MGGKRPANFEGRIGDLLKRHPVPPTVKPVRAPSESALKFREDALARKGNELWETQIPSRFREATGSKLGPDVSTVLGEWTGLARPRPNLLIVGPVGAGKTWAGCAAARALVYAGESLEFHPLVEMFEQLRPSGDPDVWERMIAADVLFLDDLGAERPTDWSNERLYALVNRRWLDERPVIATSNLSSKDLETSLGERAYSRLVGGATIVRMAGADRRRKP